MVFCGVNIINREGILKKVAFIFLLVIIFINIGSGLIQTAEIERKVQNVTVEKGTADEVAKLYFDDLADNNINSLSNRMHTDELKRFKDIILQISENNDKVSKDSEFYKSIVGNGDWEELKKLSPQEFYTRFMSFIMSRSILREAFKNSEITILGDVNEGDVTHVVYKMMTNINGMKMKKIAIISVRKDKGIWKIMLSADIENMISNFK